MEPGRDSARSAGKIPINFLLSSAADTAGTSEQGVRTVGSGVGSAELLVKRESQVSSPREVDSPRPLIPRSSISSGSSSLPGSSSPWSTTMPPIRTDRLYNTNSHTGSNSYTEQRYSPSSSRDRRSPSSQTSPERQWSSTSASDASNILVDRKPRAPRPSYSEEQKFFIMYSRIIRDNTWPEIEDRFEKLFGQRSKGGLTSVYYRVRREWGLMEVLKSGPGSYAADCREVEQRAMNFSSEFLVQIGYLSSAA